MDSPDLHLAVPALLGGLVSGAAAFYTRRSGEVTFRRLWGLFLVVAALIYVVFALLRGGRGALGLELVGLAVFALIAAAGAYRWPFALAIGWLLHAGWDLALHPMDAAATSHAPWWYPGLCVGFDLVVAGFLAATFSRGWPGAGD